MKHEMSSLLDLNIAILIVGQLSVVARTKEAILRGWLSTAGGDATLCIT